MKITRKQLINIINNSLIIESSELVPFDPLNEPNKNPDHIEKWLQKHATRRNIPGPNYLGSHDQPCPDDQLNVGIGKKMFDPQTYAAIKRGTWECNTQLEDDILFTLARYVTSNTWIADEELTEKIKYFMSKGDYGESTPMSKVTNKYVYRGMGLNWFENLEVGVDLCKNLKLKDVNWNGSYGKKTYVEVSERYRYKPLRIVDSWSDEMTVADNFSSRSARGSSIIFMTHSDYAKDSLFLKYNPAFYGLMSNPDYMTKIQGSFKDNWRVNQYVSTSRFSNESETLKVGKEPVPIQAVFIDVEDFYNKLKRFGANDPEAQIQIGRFEKALKTKPKV